MTEVATHSSGKMSSVLRIAIDLGPLVLFFVVDQFAGILPATAFLMAAVAIAFAVSWRITGEIPVLPSVTLVFVFIFGGLTLLLGDEEFIKIEVTLTNALCGLFLLGGLLMGKSLLKIAFGGMTEIDDPGWQKLTLRMGIFLIAVAVVNEVVRRSFATDLWVLFRVYGILGLTALFLLSQVSLIQRHMVEDDESCGNN